MSPWKRMLIRMMLGRHKAPPAAPPVPEREVELILTIWKRDLIADNWVELADGFDSVSIKVADGDHLVARRDALALAEQAKAAGFGIDAWGFHYCRTPKEAIEEARAAAEGCQNVGAKAYHWNAEKHWYGSKSREQSAIEFALTFRGAAPDVKLYANCFRKGVTAELAEHFDFIEPMCYGTKASTIAKKIKGRMAWKQVPSDKVAWMVGTGRKHGNKQAWGYMASQKDVPGLIQLAVRHRPASINFFRAGRSGSKKEDIMVIPNDVNPTLGEQVRKLRRALSGLKIV